MATTIVATAVDDSFSDSFSGSFDAFGPLVSPRGVPRIRLDVTGTGPTVDVFRVNPDGRTVQVRQGLAVVLIAGSVTIYDYEAPFDLAVSYFVVDGATTAFSRAVTEPSEGVSWLIHPGQPELSVPLAVLEWPTWKRPIDRGVFAPIGRANRVVVSQRRQSVEGDLVLYTATAPQSQAMESVLADGTTLLLKGTDTEGAGTRYVAVGDVAQQPTEVDLRQFTVWTLPLIEVDGPAGGALAPATYSDASATFSSYSQATTVAPTYADRSGGAWKA